MCCIYAIILLFLSIQHKGETLKTFDFLDYKDVPVEDSGWLQLKQDPANPLYLPHSFGFCTNYYRWYTRTPFISYITIKLLDKERNYQSEFRICQHDLNMPIIWSNGRKYNELDPDKAYHRLKSFQWVHICGYLDMNNAQFGLYIDGVHMGNTSTNDDQGKPPKGAGPIMTFDDYQQFELYIGNHRTVPGNMANRIIGMMQGFNMYTYIDEEMLKNISACKYQRQGDFVSSETAEWINTANNSLIVTKELEFKEICPNREPEESTVSVIPLPVLDYQTALDRCKSLTMKMTVPFNNKEHEMIISGGNSKAMVRHCFAGGRQLVLFAMQMSASGRFFDPQTNITTDDYAKSQEKWSLAINYDKMVGNGKAQVLYGYTGFHFNPHRSKGDLALRYYVDLDKAKWNANKVICFSCISNTVPQLRIRGLCPASYFDKLIYFLLDKDGYVHYYGKTKSHIGEKEMKN